MKQEYFNLDNINELSDGICSNASNLNRHKSREYNWKRAALLVLDMQDYFISPESHAFVPSAPAILPNINSLVETFDSAGRLVAFTRHLNTDTDAGNMALWWRDIIREENPLSGLSADLLVPVNSCIVNKTRYDAFHNTDLDTLLSAMEIETIVLTGVMAHLCVESTARTAFNLGYRVALAVDGIASYSYELHKASVNALAHGFALPMLTDEIIDLVRG